MNYVDFEVPAPIVQLTEYENNCVTPNTNSLIPNLNIGGFLQTSGVNCGVMQMNGSMLPVNVTDNVQYNSPLHSVLNSNGFLENNILRQDSFNVSGDKSGKVSVKNNNVAYKIVVQEVPIEF